MAKLKEKRPRHAYEVIERRGTYQDRAHSEAWLEEQLKLYSPEEMQEKEFERLNKFGAVTIPRALLEDERYTALRPATRTLFIWLLIKERVIQQKKRAGIKDDETRRLPWVTATGSELKTYTGITSKHAGEHIKALQAAGLIQARTEKTGARTEANIYKIEQLEYDHKGFLKLPVKLLLNPRYIALSYTAKTLFIVLWSQHQAAQVKQKTPVPVFKIAYSQMKNYGIKGRATTSAAISDLENKFFINVTHGKFDEKTHKNRANSYSINTAFMYEVYCPPTRRKYNTI